MRVDMLRFGGFLLAVVALYAVVSRLPPDTSLREVQRAGVLRVCIPEFYPPLVMSPAAASPGIDVELVAALAEALGVRLLLVRNDRMVRDANPRAWRVTRSQCSLLAGSVVDSPVTRSFLSTTSSHLGTGYILAQPTSGPSTLSGTTAAVYPGIVGLDRIALSRFLRDQGADAVLTGSVDELEASLRSGRAEVAVTEAALGRWLAKGLGWKTSWIPTQGAQRPGIALGAWKGDLTLKRRLDAELARIRASGELDEIISSYLGAPPASSCEPCRSATIE